MIAIRLVSHVLELQLPHLMATKTMETATLLNALNAGLGVKFPGPTRHSLQIVGRRESLHVCDAPKADAKAEPWSLSRRVTAVIAVSPRPGNLPMAECILNVSWRKAWHSTRNAPCE